jgi:hypothetical protein
MTKTPFDVEKEMQAWLASAQMDKLVDYLKRGAPYSALSEADLREEWKRSWRAMAPTDRAELAKNSDLVCEFQRREAEPPYDLVRDDFERFMASSREGIDQVLADPDRYAEISDSVANDLAEFIVGHSEEKN